MCFTLDMQNTFTRSNILSDLKLFAIISPAFNRSRDILFLDMINFKKIVLINSLLGINIK